MVSNERGVRRSSRNVNRVRQRTLRFDIITLFPHLFPPYLDESIVKRARKKKLLSFHFWNPIEFSKNKHKRIDDTPFGGGPGMLMTPQPLYDAIKAAKKANKGKVVFLTPGGPRLVQPKIRRMARECMKMKKPGLILLCGRYEGIDQRIVELLVDEEISVGDFVLTGGELPALIFIDAISRLLPGVLGDDASSEEESFSLALHGKREYPHYTKPRIFKGLTVPEVLLSGHHEKIKQWRRNNIK